MGYAPGIGGVVTVEEGFVSLMFSGVIEHDMSDLVYGFKGLVTDELGVADLSAIAIGSSEVSFNKLYRDRSQSQAIVYVLHPEGNTWAGEYRAEFRSGKVWQGPVRCVITEVDDELFKSDLETLVVAYHAAHPQPRRKVEEDGISSSVEAQPDDDGGDIPF